MPHSDRPTDSSIRSGLSSTTDQPRTDAVEPALPPALRLTADDEIKRQRLVSMKRTATGMLVAVAALFLASRLLEAQYPWLSWVRAFSEAAMVGGIAD
jgi:hypothetical protein